MSRQPYTFLILSSLLVMFLRVPHLTVILSPFRATISKVLKTASRFLKAVSITLKAISEVAATIAHLLPVPYPPGQVNRKAHSITNGLACNLFCWCGRCLWCLRSGSVVRLAGSKTRSVHWVGGFGLRGSLLHHTLVGNGLGGYVGA